MTPLEVPSPGRLMTIPRTPHRTSRALSIRTVACVASVIFTTMALLLTATWLHTTNRLQDSVDNVVEAARIRTLVAELETSLFMFQRLSDLYVVTKEAELLATRSELAARMESLTGTLEGAITDEAEREVLTNATERLQDYVLERQRLETLPLTLRDIVRRTRPEITETFKQLELLRRAAQGRIRTAKEGAEQVNRVAGVVGIAIAAALVLCAVGLIWGVLRYLLRPILTLHEAVARVHSGDTSARVKPQGLRETAELMDGLNDMVETLRKQRENQLTFLAGVAHDLRNPLSALKLGVLALQHQVSDSQREQLGARLDRQLNRLARMIEDLLDATRIEAGKLELRPEPFDLREVIEDAVRLYAPTSPEHEFHVRLPPQPVIVEGDPARLAQVLSNLLSNAIKYSPGARPIEVRLQGDANTARVDVQDHGIGIAAQDLPDIFLPFRRRLSNIRPGASLGLSVVRRIVTAHGGHIEVHSKQGEGATFCVTLPRSAPPPSATTASPADAAAPPPHSA